MVDKIDKIKGDLIRQWFSGIWEKSLAINSCLTYEEIVVNIERRRNKEKLWNIKPPLISTLIMNLFDAGKITFEEAESLNSIFLKQYEDIKE